MKGPCPSHFIVIHLAHANVAEGNGESAARSSPKSSNFGSPLRLRGLPSERARQAPNRRPLYAFTSHIYGIGAKRFCLIAPTLFSTNPFSFPERGLVKL